MFVFGKKSKMRLLSCHSDLIKILTKAISISSVDFGIAEGYRSVELQQKYFAEGKSQIDGVNRLSKHNRTPSLAVDIYPYVDGRANYDKEHLSYLAGIIHAVAKILFEKGEITHQIRWGGNWDMDGKILLDQTFDDRPHFELIKP